MGAECWVGVRVCLNNLIAVSKLSVDCHCAEAMGSNVAVWAVMRTASPT
jgi:hypothetical protein